MVSCSVGVGVGFGVGVGVGVGVGIGVGVGVGVGRRSKERKRFDFDQGSRKKIQATVKPLNHDRQLRDGRVPKMVKNDKTWMARFSKRKLRFDGLISGYLNPEFEVLS